MQGTMNAASKGEECWTVGVKTVTAIGTTNHNGQPDRHTEQDQPDKKDLDNRIPSARRLQR